MSKRKFNFMEFMDQYGWLFDADVYTKDAAFETFIHEYEWDFEKQQPNDTFRYEDWIVVEDYVKWKPKMSEEDMWYMDIYDPTDNRGMYQTCNKDDKRAFKCWRVVKKEIYERF